MITLDRSLPFGEVLGQTHDGCRYRQGKYRFTADGNVIGDSIKFELEARQEKIAVMQAALATQMEEVNQMNAEIQMIAHNPSAIPTPAVAEVPAPAPGIHFQTVAPNQPDPQAVAPVAPVAPAVAPVAPAAPAVPVAPAAPPQIPAVG